MIGRREPGPEADRSGGPSRGSDDDVGRPGIPACGLGERGEGSSVMGSGVQAAGPEYEPDRGHGGHRRMSGANSRPGGGLASFEASEVRCPPPARIDLRPISGFRPRGSQETRSTVLHRLADDHRTPRDGRRTGLRRPRLCVSRVRPRPGPGVDCHGRGGPGGHQSGSLRARGHLGLSSHSPGAVGHGRRRADLRSHRPGGRGRRRPLLHRSSWGLGRRPGSGGR